MKLNLNVPIGSGKRGGKYISYDKNYTCTSCIEKKEFELFDFLKEFHNSVIKVLENMKEKIRQYLGYKAAFTIFYRGRFVAINRERIIAAFHLVTGKSSVVDVENALYF